MIFVVDHLTRSAFMFFKDAVALRGQLTGKPQTFDSTRFRRPVYWDVRPVRTCR